jgi:hypothetical protein
MMKIPIRAVGLTWFREEDYPALLRIFEDSDKMHATWEEWLASAKQTEQRVKAQGQIAERINIDPDTFPDWCRKEGVGINREGRSKFVAVSMAAKYRNQS